MKKITFIFFLFFIFIQLKAQMTNTKEMTDTFTDKVKDIKMVNQNLEIYLNVHAAIYKISKNHPEFKKLKQFIENKMKEKKDIKIQFIIPSMEIKSASEP